MTTSTTYEATKKIAQAKLQVALDNLIEAELEGAETFAPDTYHWAKQKIYEDKKIILKNLNDQKAIEEASDDASAAAAQLLSVVKRQKRDPINANPNKSISEQEAIKNLVNEGGPAV